MLRKLILSYAQLRLTFSTFPLYPLGTVGDEIGYTVRFDDRTSARTRIKVSHRNEYKYTKSYVFADTVSHIEYSNSLTHSLNHSITQSLNHTITHSLTQSLTHSLTGI